MVNKKIHQEKGLLQQTRVYLSGPMDFVASRADEKKRGWRTRVGEFLSRLGVTVLDPWNKPDIRGLHEYGREGVDTTNIRESWAFEDSPEGAKARARCAGTFWESMHIDLRMVDTSDFIIAYCPTNIYSVGTVHEIVLCRQQRKPVLFVSPQVIFQTLNKLRNNLKGNETGNALLDQLINEIPIKENPKGIPSLWYMPLVGVDNFFDGFGFSRYRKRFGWERTPLDDFEDGIDLRRPLLPYLEKLNKTLPKKWDNKMKRYVRNDDWLIWDFQQGEGKRTEVSETYI